MGNGTKYCRFAVAADTLHFPRWLIQLPNLVGCDDDVFVLCNSSGFGFVLGDQNPSTSVLLSICCAVRFMMMEMFLIIFIFFFHFVVRWKA